ncbi:MAG: hypothetical protein JXR76_10970 [Deltaproteobacteria bacterium]|nr:hypothetical protein [Deltaproteobacteria bacterium]
MIFNAPSPQFRMALFYFVSSSYGVHGALFHALWATTNDDARFRINEKTVDLDGPSASYSSATPPASGGLEADGHGAANADGGLPWYLTEPFVTMRFGPGYAHPILKIPKRNGPSLAVEMGFTFWARQLGFGIFILSMFDVSDKRQFALNSDQTKNGVATTVEGRPIMLEFGFSLGLVLYQRAKWRH